MKPSHLKDYHLHINHAVGFCCCDMVVRQHCHIINSAFLSRHSYREAIKRPAADVLKCQSYLN